MTDSVNSMIVAFVGYRCLDFVTNLDTQEQLETLVTDKLSSYNDTREQGWPELPSENLEDTRDTIINLLKGYVRGKLPRDLDNNLRQSTEPVAEIFEVPETITYEFVEMEVPEEVPVDRDNIITMIDVNGLEVTYQELDFPDSEPGIGGNAPAPSY